MSARKALAWSVTANFLFFVIQFGASVILARLLTATEMGIYAISMSVLWVVNAFQNLGLPGYVVREREMEPARLGTVCTIATIQGFLLASLLWLGAPVVAELVDEPRVTSSLRVICLYALLQPVPGVLIGLLQRHMRFRATSTISLGNAFVAAVVTVIGAYLGLSYMSLAWGAVAGSVFQTIAIFWVQRRELRMPVTLILWREVWAYGSRILATVSVQNIFGRMPDIILGRLASVATIGFYNRGSGLIDTLNRSVGGSFTRISGSLFRQHRDQIGSIHSAYVRMLRIITGIFWPAYAGLAVLSAPVISLLYGDRWLPATPILSLLAVAAIVNQAVPCQAEALITMGYVNRMPRLETIRGASGVMLFTVGAFFGAAPAAATRIIEGLVAVSVYLPVVRLASGVSLQELMRAYVCSALVTVAAIIPATALMVARDWPDSLPAVELFGAVAAGIVCWLGAIFAVRHELRGEIERVARKFFIPWGLRQ